ncbi:MAG: polyphosphate kinase 1 [Lentisphaerae bacterium]|nr:polyphosphate kinase 1 [Lentisphaerota bacterium]
MIITTRKPATGSATFSDTGKSCISRDISWLDFNSRVLEEAADVNAPVLDKLKFISIYSGNLDEFFAVRVAGLQHLTNAGIKECDPAGLSPETQLDMIRQKTLQGVKKQYALLQNDILPQLKENGIKLHKFTGLDIRQQKRLSDFFIREIMPVLTPLAVDPQKKFPLLNSGVIEIAVSVYFPRSGKKITAFVEVPEILDRFIRIKGETGDANQKFILLEDLISANISKLFSGGVVKGIQHFRIIRDMDYSVSADNDGDFVHVLRDKLRKRSLRTPVKIEFSEGVSDHNLQKYLIKNLQLDKKQCYFAPGLLHLKQLDKLIAATGRNDLMEEVWEPAIPEYFSGYSSVIDAIRDRKNLLLYHPYQSFDPILKLLQEAASDPEVVAIKQTLYRVSGDSPVIKALQKAAANGKQVTALVEVKARFNEISNIAWAELLDQSGVHVVYGVPELKVHSKILLIARKENNSLTSYIHLGTGNYNDITAKSYTDLSLLSDDRQLTADAAKLFNLLSGNGEPPARWNQISVAPFDLREKFIFLIRREIRLGQQGRIIAKMNSFSDPELISLIQKAADAGVKIDLIVRGICCLRPEAGQKNLRIISIIDRYLEHSRIFYFGNNGNAEIYASSADWMPRNLDRRIETMFPITDRKHREVIMQILDFHLADDSKQRRLLASGGYTKANIPGKYNRSQKQIYNFLRKIQD